MKTTKKAFLLALCAVLLIVSTVFATLAYLTSTTEVVQNTFTVGNVKITLDEGKVDEYGQNPNGRTSVGNEYKLIPGHTYIKDPIVYIDEQSEKCYVFVEVINNIAGIEDSASEKGTIEGQMIALGWTNISETNIWYYNAPVDPAADNADLELEVFNNFTVSGDADVSSYATETNKNSRISITAYAVQADGFDDATEAWTATFGANKK